jgi:tetratricopeptide (TPR) repeat protein
LAVTLFLLVLALAVAAAAQESEADPYKEGMRLFEEKDYAAALEQFKKADAVLPNEPLIYSWMGACLNALGKYSEAEERLKAAFVLLKEEQIRAVEQGASAPPIDIGYFALLAGIQVSLHQFERAVETFQGYVLVEDGSEKAAKAKEALDLARRDLVSKLARIGVECLNADDLVCARTAFEQADVLHHTTPSVLESVAKETWDQAEKAPGATDADKAHKAELQQTAVKASRLWVDGAGSREAQRQLAKALSGTKTQAGYEEASRILTSLWEGYGDPSQRDASIQLDLALAQAGLEHWQPMADAASTFIKLNPNDPLGQAYCMRSFARFKLGKCKEAIEDGEHCKNADGTPRPLKHLDACRDRLTREAAAVQAQKDATLERECAHLYDRGKWARNSLGGVPIEDLVQVIAEYQANEAKCASYLDSFEKEDTGQAFSSPISELCDAGAKEASSPLNLSMRSKEELEALRDHIMELTTVCKSRLDAAQVTAVQGGLQKVEQALERLQ